MLKKFFMSILAAMILTTVTVFAADEETKTDTSYKYISRTYNYSIMCPKRPNIVPASIFYDDNNKKGEVLIFENEEYNVKRGWIILFDAFNTNAVPDFNKDAQNLIDAYLGRLQKNGYEGTTLININEQNKGVFAITALEIEVDEDGDGKPDATLTSDHQDAVTFFRMADGRCVSVELMGSDGLNEAAISNYRKALMTLRNADEADQSEINSKDKKDSNDKKSKKDKKDKNNKKDKKK